MQLALAHFFYIINKLNQTNNYPNYEYCVCIQSLIDLILHCNLSLELFQNKLLP